MNKPQRIVLIAYCLLIVYCCLWVPWHMGLSPASNAEDQVRFGYGWLWSGPLCSPWVTDCFTASIKSKPDLPIIGLRLLAATAFAGAAFLVSHKL